jgi:hypothetical protein
MVYLVNVTLSVVTTIGALLAAAFSGIALLTTSNLEHRKWVRDALVESIVECLTIDLRGAKLARTLAEASATGINQGTQPDARTLAELTEIHGSSLDILTRLRLLAGATTFEAAYRMHSVYDQWIELAHTSSAATPDNRVQELQQRSAKARQTFVEQARRELKLKGDARTSGCSARARKCACS